MRLRAALAVLAATAVVVPTALVSGKPSQSQTLFKTKLLEDRRTAAGVKRLLRTGQGIVDPRSGFTDVTGDGRSDALVFITTNGAAGSVAFYVFSTHGEDEDADLRVVFRHQSLHRAQLRLSGTTITLVQPQWAAGDDLCCPGKMIERDYAFDARTRTFARQGGTREVDGPGEPDAARR